MRSIIFVSIFLFSCLTILGQQQLIINSKYLNKPDTVWVFKPEAIKQNELLPLMYLLHGWSGNYKQWNNVIDCQAYANKYNTIIVCPDGLCDSWYIDSPAENENNYASFFISDLASVISTNFNVNTDSIFITGLSMGGHGALYLFEMNPDYFLSAGSLSGLLELINWSNHYGLNRILDLHNNTNDDNILWDYSVMGNLEKLYSTNKKIIVSCGSEDAFLLNNEQFVAQCKKSGIDVTFIKSRGNHNATYWRYAIDDQFDFFFK